MNWEQLKAIVWLRSRLSINQWRKGGPFNFAVMVALVAGVMIFAALSFFLAIGLGIFLLPRATPNHVIIVWDTMVAILLFSWLTSLLVEVQRMELLSLEKLLHLPMTLRDAFLLNYLSSVICLNIVCFVPPALGLTIALAVTKGPQMLLLFPILASFILMLTAVTYQFRGWLSSMMSDKRRQRTVVVFITMSFVAFAQVPNIVIQLSLPDGKATQRKATEQNAKEQEINNQLTRQEITIDEHRTRISELRAAVAAEKGTAAAASKARIDGLLTTINQVVPVGWLPYSSKQLIEGPAWPALLCLAAMTTIGSLSLWRSYASTIRFYTGNQKVRKPRAATAQAVDRAAPSTAKRMLVERSIPRFSEHTSAIAFCSMQNLIRAPEAKMVLIGPGVMGLMLVLLIVSNRVPQFTPGLEPFVWLGGLAVMTFMCMMLLMNVFGMDRNGFRCFVLMPVRRSDILIGKNASMMPLVMAMSLFFAGCLSYFAPVGVLNVFAHFCQAVTTFLLACLAGNWVSICFPIAMVPGAGKPVQVNWATMLVQMLVIMSCPLFVAPALVFVTIEWAIKTYFQLSFIPIYAVLSAVELWLVIVAYRYAITRQGTLLQSRETKILEVLTVPTE